MSQLRVRKIEYIVYLEKLDDEDNVVDEVNTQQPLTLWPYQFGNLRDELEIVRTKIENQQSEQAELDG